MTLSTGTRLSHYEITSRIGKGGMGEVYQAKDRKLGRDVAIKVLPEEFALDADRIARFQREAKLLASLNHPNIAAIYGLEESEGTHFLVMELIEGQTLDDRIKAGPLPVEEALKLALQIAEALEAAHEKGVIHRDLKPANIKVTADGKVKVLDFGLAKAFAGGQSDLNLSNSPTLSDMATQQGVILGTAGYMSPEQAKGKTVDRRADIWAFGVVLFEMLTARQVFTGETVSDTLASVLAREPQWQILPTNLHPRIRLLLERCLEKDPRNRYSSISDARVDIHKGLADPGGVYSQPFQTVKPRKKIQVGLPWLAVPLVLGLIIAGLSVWKLKPSEAPKIMKFSDALSGDQHFQSTYGFLPLAVSPDGDYYAYLTNEGLYLRSMDELNPKLISKAEEEPHSPFFSPDGQWLGYATETDQRLKKIAISGGAPVTLCNASGILGASWSANDTILYGVWGSGTFQVSAKGGTPELLFKVSGYQPRLLPDGKTVMYTDIMSKPFQVKVHSLESGEQKLLFEGSAPYYLPSGHIVHNLENSICAVPFDIGRLETTAGAVPFVEGVSSYAISNSGTLVYIPGKIETNVPKTLVWVDLKGNEEPVGAAPRAYNNPRISPDGTWVALSITVDDNEDIYTYDLVRGTMTRLTFDEANDFLPVWTPDSKRIIFHSQRGGKRGIYWKAANGTGMVEPIVSMTSGFIWPYSLPKDGKNLFFDQFIDGSTGVDLGMLSMEGDHNPEPLLQKEYFEGRPQISPDGKWFAYMSNETGQQEIYIRPFPDVDSGGKWQVSTSGGMDPRWSPDGKTLFYRGSDGIMAVSVETDPAIRLEMPETLFPDKYIVNNCWDIHPDGRRFLMVKEAKSESETSKTENKQPNITIVLNWFEELKERVPVK